ncbi:MAG: hypothetical protein CM15mP74_29180 [Halieaceae bacterium]|nr:MAG: hypothetical protein CM15mP74_29180 [Halieaceae bacterium]
MPIKRDRLKTPQGSNDVPCPSVGGGTGCPTPGVALRYRAFPSLSPGQPKRCEAWGRAPSPPFAHLFLKGGRATRTAIPPRSFVDWGNHAPGRYSGKTRLAFIDLSGFSGRVVHQIMFPYRWHSRLTPTTPAPQNFRQMDVSFLKRRFSSLDISPRDKWGWVGGPTRRADLGAFRRFRPVGAIAPSLRGPGPSRDFGCSVS